MTKSSHRRKLLPGSEEKGLEAEALRFNEDEPALALSRGIRHYHPGYTCDAVSPL